MHLVTSRRAIQAVALLEALKGFVVLGAGFGMLSLLHHDVRHVAVALVTHLNLDPERHYTGLFLDAASRVTDAKLWAFAGLALCYSAIRISEGYGLWFNHPWAAWLGAASGALYVPVEIWELWHRPSVLKGLTLLFNVAVVAYLLWLLRRAKPGHIV